MRFVKNLIKDALFLAHSGELGSRASILSYHNIGKDDAFFTVRPQEFERQLAFIKKERARVIPVSDLLTRLKNKEDISGCVSLTFNDGYKSFYTDVLPRLKQYGIPATLFLAAEVLDASVQTSDGYTFSMISHGEVRECLDSGLVECMPRAPHRQSLKTIAFEQAAEYIDNARRDIETLTGKEAPVFSYAKGGPTDRLAEYMRAHNWLGAAINEEGLVHPDTNPFALPRNSINSHTTFTQFKGKISGAVEAYLEW